MTLFFVSEPLTYFTNFASPATATANKKSPAGLPEGLGAPDTGGSQAVAYFSLKEANPCL